jgi:hypothetical protein
MNTDDTEHTEFCGFYVGICLNTEHTDDTELHRFLFFYVVKIIKT